MKITKSPTSLPGAPNLALYFKVCGMRVCLLEGVDVWAWVSYCRQLLTKLSVDKLYVSGVLPGLSKGPLNFLHSVPQLLVALLQGRHLLLQLLDMVFLVKQGFLD